MYKKVLIIAVIVGAIQICSALSIESYKIANLYNSHQSDSLSSTLTDDIKHIREVYKRVKKDIEYSKKNGYDGILYCNTLEENVYGKSYPIVGTYHKKESYWYHADAFSDDPEQIPNYLQMVIETSQLSATTYYTEYLYEDGELIFAYCKGAVEVRYYFKNNKLIKQIGEAKEYGDAYSLEEIRNNAKRHLKIH